MKITKKDFSKSITITKIALRSIGILIHKRRQPISKIKLILSQSFFAFCFLLLAVTIFCEIIYLLKSISLNFLAVTNVAPCICYCIIGLVKIGAVAHKMDKSEELLNDLEDLWSPEGLDEAQTKMLLSYMGKGSIATNIFTMYNFLFIWTFNLSSLIVLIIQYIKTGAILKTLPYYIYMPFDTTGTYIYPFAYLFHIAAGCIASTGMSGPDSFFITTLTHICTQFKLLQHRIQNIVEEITAPDLLNSLDVNHNYHDKMYDALIGCIKRHSELITLANTVEEIFSLSILVNFLGSSIMICCVGFQSTAVSGMEMVVFLMFLGVGLIQTFILCWAGNHLIDTSKEIADAAYNSSWYLTDKKYRQLIHIIMLRAQRPQMVTALRFSVVSIRSFSSILSSAWSYFTLLQTSYRDK